jgi:hypothetical protein
VPGDLAGAKLLGNASVLTVRLRAVLHAVFVGSAFVQALEGAVPADPDFGLVTTLNALGAAILAWLVVSACGRSDREEAEEN